MPKIRQTNKVMKVGNQWLPAFLNDVGSVPTYTYMSDSGQWADAYGNTYSTEYPLDEVVVMPGSFKQDNNYVNRLAYDYSRKLFNYNKENNPRTKGLESIIIGYPTMFTPQGALGMIAGYAVDQGLNHAVGKTFDQLGREYIAPYLQKLGVASDASEDIGGFIGEMINPGLYAGNIGAVGAKFVPKVFNSVKKYPSQVRQRGIEMAIRSTPVANPISDIRESFLQDFDILRTRQLWKDAIKNVNARNTHVQGADNQLFLPTTFGKYINEVRRLGRETPHTATYDPTRIYQQLRYLFTGRGSGDPRRYKSFSPRSVKDDTNYPSYYTGFKGNVDELIDAGAYDMIDAIVHNRTIDEGYGLKLVDIGKDFEGAPGYIAKNYADKADKIPTYEMTGLEKETRVPISIDDKTVSEFGPANGDLGKILNSDKPYVNAAGHRVRFARTSNGGTAAQEQDIFKFNSSDYTNKWKPGNYYIPGWLGQHKNIYKWLTDLGLRVVDKHTTPVITKTPWYYLGDEKLYPTKVTP